MLVEKEVIAPGTYWYEDQKTGLPRKWVVTPETTKYLHEQGNAMLSHGLQIPVPCEHDFNAHPMTPAEKLLNNAGQVKEYRIRNVKKGENGAEEDKESVLFSVVDIQDEEVAKKIPGTIKWTSPWITSFMDGNGRSWNNVIAHLALTTRPRVTKQTSFTGIAGAMAFALNAPTDKVEMSKPGLKEGITLSKAGRLIEKDGKLRPQYPIAFSLYAGGIKLSDEDMPSEDEFPKKKAKKDGEKGGKDGGGSSSSDGGMPKKSDLDKSMPENARTDGEGGDKNPHADQHGDVRMEELLCDLLNALGVYMPETVGESEFKRCLYEASMAKIKELTGKAQGTGVYDPLQKPPTNQPPKPGTGGSNSPTNPLIHQEQQPMYMSLEDINKIPDETMKTIALSMYNENVKLRSELEMNTKATESLRDAKLKEENTKRTNRIGLLSKLSPRVKTDLEAMLALPSMALSMGEGGAVIDPMAQTLAVLEKGLADLPRLLTTEQSAVFAHPQPTDADALTQERTDELADNLARQMGAPPLERKAG